MLWPENYIQSGSISFSYNYINEQVFFCFSYFLHNHFTTFHWSIIALECCASFFSTTKWIIYMCTRMCTHTRVHTCTHTRVYMYTCVHTHMCAYTHAYTCVCIYVCAYTCVCAYIHIPSHPLHPSHPSRSSQSIELRSLCYIAASHWLANMVVYLVSATLSIHPTLSFPLCVWKSMVPILSRGLRLVESKRHFIELFCYKRSFSHAFSLFSRYIKFL